MIRKGSQMVWEVLTASIFTEAASLCLVSNVLRTQKGEHTLRNGHCGQCARLSCPSHLAHYTACQMSSIEAFCELCIPREHAFSQTCWTLAMLRAPHAGSLLPVPRTTTSYSGAISSIATSSEDNVAKRRMEEQLKSGNYR